MTARLVKKKNPSNEEKRQIRFSLDTLIAFFLIINNIFGSIFVIVVKPGIYSKKTEKEPK